MIEAILVRFSVINTLRHPNQPSYRNLGDDTAQEDRLSKRPPRKMIKSHLVLKLFLDPRCPDSLIATIGPVLGN